MGAGDGSAGRRVVPFGVKNDGSERFGKKKRLSRRIMGQRNIREELWKATKSVTASRNEPLFDASTQRSMALADLGAMSLAQVTVHLVWIQSGCA